MRLRCIVILLFLFSTCVLAQEELPPQDVLQYKLDSIVQEADLLYSLERAAWIATDRAVSRKTVKKEMGKYVSYHRGDTVIVVINSRENPDICVYEARFLSQPFKFLSESFSRRALTHYERELFRLKSSMISFLTKHLEQYSFTIPPNTGLNYIILPYGQFFKVYVITGSHVQHIVPFGNDGLFIIDAEANIISWRKFHKSFIPLKIDINPDRQVVSYTHSHLPDEPFITATDICTFRLYADFHKMKEFSVYSTYYKKRFVYNIDDNRITVQ